MSNNTLEFFVKMRDLMSGGLHKLAQTSHGVFTKIKSEVDSTAMHIKGKLSEAFSLSNVTGALGISAGIYGLSEVVKASLEKTHLLHASEAGLKNTMQNMGTYSEEAFEKVVKGSEDLASKMKFSKADVIDLQSQLRLVGSIGEDEMVRLAKASADMATKFHLQLNDAGNAIAKAVNNPEMMRRLAMQLKIDPRQVEHIQELAKHGKEAAARLELLAIVEHKVGGAAEAAFNADPLARFHKMMEKVQLKVGDLAIKIQTKLAVALEWIVKRFKDLYHWGQENADLLRTIGNVVGAVAITWGVFSAATAVATLATKVWAGAVSLLNGVLTANPIVVIVGLILSLIVYFYRAKHATESWGDSLKNLWAISKDVIKLLIVGFEDAFETIAYGANNIWLRSLKMRDDVTHWLFKSSTDNYTSPYAAQLKALQDHHDAISGQRKETMQMLRSDISTRWNNGNPSTGKKDSEVRLTDLMPGGGAKSGGGAGGSDKSVAAGVTGGGPRVINISFKNMVEKLDIHASGVTEGLHDMERKVEEQFLRILNSGASVQGN